MTGYSTTYNQPECKPCTMRCIITYKGVIVSDRRNNYDVPMEHPIAYLSKTEKELKQKHPEYKVFLQYNPVDHREILNCNFIYGQYQINFRNNNTTTVAQTKDDKISYVKTTTINAKARIYPNTSLEEYGKKSEEAWHKQGFIGNINIINTNDGNIIMGSFNLKNGSKVFRLTSEYEGPQKRPLVIIEETVHQSQVIASNGTIQAIRSNIDKKMKNNNYKGSCNYFINKLGKTVLNGRYIKTEVDTYPNRTVHYTYEVFYNNSEQGLKNTSAIADKDYRPTIVTLDSKGRKVSERQTRSYRQEDYYTPERTQSSKYERWGINKEARELKKMEEQDAERKRQAERQAEIQSALKRQETARLHKTRRIIIETTTPKPKSNSEVWNEIETAQPLPKASENLKALVKKRKNRKQQTTLNF